MTKELIAKLRTATVADSADSLYQLLSAAADKIEVLDSLNLALADSLQGQLEENQRLRFQPVLCSKCAKEH